MPLILRQRNYAVLWLGSFVSGLGDWFLVIALPFYVYNLTGSALATGGTFIAESVPWILFGSVAGVFVDRWDRRATMIVADSLRAVLLLGLLVVRSPETLWIVYAVSFVQASIGQFFGPAKGALLPRIVAEDELLGANSLMSTGFEVTRLVGPPLGGAALALFGLASCVLADSASFAFSVLMVALLRTSGEAAREGGGPARSASNVLGRIWQEYLAGLRLIRANRVVSVLLVVTGMCMLGQGLINVMLVPWVKDILRGDAALFGWIASAQGVGGILGGLAIARVSTSLPAARMFGLGLLVTGIFVVAAVTMPLLPLMLAFVALAGAGVIGVVVAAQTLMQLAVEDAYRGRVLGAYGTTYSALLLVGMVVAGAVGDPLGPVVLLDFGGILYALSGMVAAVVLPRAAGFLMPREAIPCQR